jgi:hypothetical protein
LPGRQVAHYNRIFLKIKKFPFVYVVVIMNEFVSFGADPIMAFDHV